MRRTVSLVVGPAATALLEHLVDMRTFHAPPAGAVPSNFAFPAQWAYDRPEFVRLFAPSIALLQRIDCRQAYRCYVEAVPSRG